MSKSRFPNTTAFNTTPAGTTPAGTTPAGTTPAGTTPAGYTRPGHKELRERAGYYGNSAATDKQQVPAGLKAAITWGYIEDCFTVLDWGSGTGVQAAAYLQDKLYNPVYMPYDPYNIEPLVNSRSIRHAIAGRHNVVTCFNCLNVLTDNDLHGTIEILHTYATRGNNGKGCKVLISVYEGDRKGHGRPTMQGASFQRNEKAAAYMPALKARFSSVKRSRGLFICTP